ncbi:MAG: hypothetical protein ACRCX8_19630 [Sarcina sp.]
MIEQTLKEYRKEEARILSLDLVFKTTPEQEDELFRLRNKHKIIQAAMQVLTHNEYYVINSLFINTNSNSKVTLTSLAAEANYSGSYLALVKRKALKKLDEVLEGVEL